MEGVQGVEVEVLVEEEAEGARKLRRELAKEGNERAHLSFSVSLLQIRLIDRKQEVPHDGAMCDLLWSDPDGESIRGSFPFKQLVATSFR